MSFKQVVLPGRRKRGRLRETEGGGERLTVRRWRGQKNRKGREELNNVWRLFLLYYILYDRICDLQVLG